MKTQIKFLTSLPALANRDLRAVCGEWQSPPMAVAESIARRLGLSVCGGPRLDSASHDGSRVHHEAMIGRPLRSGGYTDAINVAYTIYT